MSEKRLKVQITIFAQLITVRGRNVPHQTGGSWWVIFKKETLVSQISNDVSILSLSLSPPDLNGTCPCSHSIHLVRFPVICELICCRLQLHTGPEETWRGEEPGNGIISTPRYPRCLRLTLETATADLHLHLKKQEMPWCCPCIHYTQVRDMVCFPCFSSPVNFLIKAYIKRIQWKQQMEYQHTLCQKHIYIIHFSHDNFE